MTSNAHTDDEATPLAEPPALAQDITVGKPGRTKRKTTKSATTSKTASRKNKASAPESVVAPAPSPENIENVEVPVFAGNEECPDSVAEASSLTQESNSKREENLFTVLSLATTGLPSVSENVESVSRQEYEELAPVEPPEGDDLQETHTWPESARSLGSFEGNAVDIASDDDGGCMELISNTHTPAESAEYTGASPKASPFTKEHERRENYEKLTRSSEISLDEASAICSAEAVEQQSELQTSSTGEIFERNDLLRLIVAQLQYYELTSVAQVLAKVSNLPDYSFEPSPRLMNIVSGALNEERGLSARLAAEASVEDASCVLLTAVTEHRRSNRLEGRQAGHGSLETFKDDAKENASCYTYLPGFCGSFRSPVFASAFSSDGRTVVSASHDSTIRVMDVDTLDDLLNERLVSGSEGEDFPVIKTLYENAGPLHDISFHPNNLVLASGSDDCLIRFYDLTRSGSRRSFRYLADTYPVYSVAFHPGGQFLIAGTAHSRLRLYDVTTFKCFTSVDESHAGGTTRVRAAQEGRLFASTGHDASIRLWDAVDGRCVASWRRAHDGAAVTSLQWSRNGAYILSAGQDSVVRLWDVVSGRVVKMYYGAHMENSRLSACFTCNEQQVIATDEKTSEIVFWDTHTGSCVQRLPSRHRDASTVRVSSSGEGLSLMSYGNDGKFCYWGVKDGAMSGLSSHEQVFKGSDSHETEFNIINDEITNDYREALVDPKTGLLIKPSRRQSLGFGQTASDDNEN